MLDAHTKYDNWSDFVHAAESGQSVMSVRERHSRDRSRREWHGSASFEQTVELALHGWPDGVAGMSDRLDVLMPMLPTRRSVPELIMAAVGPGTLDMNRYTMGHPEPWHTWRPSEFDEDIPNGQIVPVYFNISTSCGVNAETMYEKGALICALIDLLERSGRRAEVILQMGIIDYGGYGNNGILFEVTVKRAQDPLDLDRVAFALANASCFRRLGFSLLEQLPHSLRAKYSVGYGYGYPMPTKHMPEQREGIVIDASTLAEGDYRFTEQRKWLQRALELYGITLEEA